MYIQQAINNSGFISREQYQQDLQKQRVEEYDRYISMANRLESDIRALQNRVNNTNRTRREYIPVYTTVPQTITSVAPVRDTIFIKDTLVIRDTVYSNNIIQLAGRKDTIIQTIVKADTVRMTIEKTAAIDYTKLPETVILFGLNQAVIQKTYYARLNYLVGILQKEPRLIAHIAGHTDKTGSAKANEILSVKRANAVKQYLQTRGVQQKQLTVHGFADSRPTVEGNSQTANSQNRRVVIYLASE